MLLSSGAKCAGATDVTTCTDGFDHYWRGDDVETGAYREVADGYELIVLRIGGLCMPVLINRLVIHVAHDGQLTGIESEEFERMDDACA